MHIICPSASPSNIVLMAIYCGFLLVPLAPSVKRIWDSQRDQLQTTYTSAHSRKQNSLIVKVLFYRNKTLSMFLDFFCSFSCGLPQLLSLWCLLSHKTWWGNVTLVGSLDSQELQGDSARSRMNVNFIFPCRLKEKKTQKMIVNDMRWYYFYMCSI